MSGRNLGIVTTAVLFISALANAGERVRIEISTGDLQNLKQAAKELNKHSLEAGAKQAKVAISNSGTEATIDILFPEYGDLDELVGVLIDGLGPDVKIDKVTIDKLVHGTQDSIVDPK
ncbi:MAG: hypothetical protein V4760_18190 [Bdellovibrionota bacterium]